MVAESVASDLVWQAPGVRIDNLNQRCLEEKVQPASATLRVRRPMSSAGVSRKMWLRFFDKLREIGA